MDCADCSASGRLPSEESYRGDPCPKCKGRGTLDSPCHPRQPIVVDTHGVARFKKNEIVRCLLDAGPFDMNHLGVGRFSREDREQFAQLIGYSVSGFGDLSYASDEVYDEAAAEVETKLAERTGVGG